MLSMMHRERINNKKPMSKVKFVEDYQSGRDVFVRNGIWDYIDKYETLVDDRLVFRYRISANDSIHVVPEEYLVEIDYVINKDYTREGWHEFVMTDAIVEDGDYVKAWMEINGINKPVKDTADQCDYRPDWKRLQKKIDKLYGNGGFERP